MRKLLILACTLGLAAPALAQEGPSASIVAGAGFGGFTSDLGSNSSVGVAWQVRAGVELMRFFGAELNYQGASSAANTIMTPAGAASGSHITENQLTADAKIGYPFTLGSRVLQPYGIIGIGYGHIGVDGSLSPAGLTSQNAAAFPLGVGLSYDLTSMLLIDARYTYNALTETVGNTWNVAFNLGARFGG